MFEEQLRSLPPDPPRPVAALPGLAFRRAVPGMALVFPVIFLIFFATVPLSLIQSDPTLRFALSKTATITGHVLSVETTYACKSEKSHRVIYQFSPTPGTNIRGRATVCEQSVFYSVKEGEPVEIQYLQSDPVLSRLRSNGLQNDLAVYLFIFTPVFILAMFTTILWPPLYEVYRARRLFQYGRLATGTVIFVKQRSNSAWRGWAGNTAAQVFIEFTDAAGARSEGVASCQNAWLVDQLEAGQQVHIAHREQLRKVLLLEAFLR
jgi:hypothetical protein